MHYHSTDYRAAVNDLTANDTLRWVDIGGAKKLNDDITLFPAAG